MHQSPTVPVDLSPAGVDAILAALTAAGVTTYDHEVDGDGIVVHLASIEEAETRTLVLLWRDDRAGWRVIESTASRYEDRTWPIAATDPAGVARRTAEILADLNGSAAEPDLHQQLADQLRRLADDIVTRRLPLGERMSASLHIGVLDSRADLEQWAEYFGGTVEVGATNGIPHTQVKIAFSDKEYGPDLTVMAQIRAERQQQAGGAR